MKRIICVILGLFLLMIAGDTANDARKAEAFLRRKGYEIVIRRGDVYTFIVDQSQVVSPYRDIWGLQKVEPDQYCGKEVHTYRFVVRNHPLSPETSVSVMICQGNVIGGYTSRYTQSNSMLGVFSLDGKTIEEVTGLDFMQWQEQWIEKYGE